MIYENGNINLQSALNHLVDIGIQNPNKLMEYAHNPPAFLGSQAGLLINMAADMVGRKRQEAQTAPPPTATVKDQNIAKLAQSVQPGIGAINPMMAMQQQDMMQRAQPMEQPSPQMMAQGGLAELDTGDMFNEHNYAGGGIVAFNDGGDVKHYDGMDGSYVLGDDQDWTDEYRDTRALGQENLLARAYGKPTKSVKEAGIKTPYDAQIDYYKDVRKKVPITAPAFGEINQSIKALENRRGAWLAGSLDPYSKTSPVGSALNMLGNQDPVISATDTKYTPPKEPTAEDLDKQVKKDKANANALKKANDDYISGMKQANADQVSSYDQAMDRMMKLYKDDPYAKQLREDYEKNKSDAMYDVLGRVGQSLMKAKRGQEFDALSEGVAGGQSVLSDLKKQKKDLLLAEQKANHEAMLAGAKYGFESEQFKAAIASKEKIAQLGANKDLQVANIISGSKDRALQLAAAQKYNKALEDWSKGRGMMTVQWANMKPTGDKEHDAQITQAKQVLAAKQRELMLQFGMQPTNTSSISTADDSLISKYLTKTKPEED